MFLRLAFVSGPVVDDTRLAISSLYCHPYYRGSMYG
jgi:hypothetical protein